MNASDNIPSRVLLALVASSREDLSHARRRLDRIFSLLNRLNWCDVADLLNEIGCQGEDRVVVRAYLTSQGSFPCIGRCPANL